MLSIGSYLRYYSGMIWLALLLTLGWLISGSDIFETWPPTQLSSWISHDISLNIVLFSITFSVLTAMGLPRQISAFVAGYVFGIYIGVILATTVTAMGALMSYLVARHLINGPFINSLKRRNQRMIDIVRRHTFSSVLAIRLFPVGNNLLVNLLAGSARISLLPFLCASYLGYLPQTLIFSLSGSGLQPDSQWQILLGIGLFIISTLLGIRLYRRRAKFAITPVAESPLHDKVDLHG
ncbi:TVP38/TMEM64 family protein [Lacimicrobium alkaliphilum]|uniref:TVP38/TMEM64 family membrane protein n=1 Tax=Lacimicrobium alkaliphilum TaxID=1526571 RepID=A0ABQ1RG44_9ALTE|nr:VTT domain-containing protein [Lacimicrobium alkaliphilum]GGD68680.1 DedA family protein [Lacimicrobium alkaliphilum]